MEKTAMNEDVSPIKNGDFPMSLLVFTRVPCWLVEQMRGVGLTRAADSSKKPIGQPWGS